MGEPAKKLATAEDLLALGEDRDHEILDGELVQRAMPAFRHGRRQRALGGTVGDRFDRDGAGPKGPGGWWIVIEVEVQLTLHRVYRPDVVGWRRERMPEPPAQWPVAVRPDWVCEVLSADRGRDRVKKLHGYAEAEVPHYWIVDPDAGTLEVLRWQPHGYAIVLSAERGDTVRPEPFEAMEITIDELLGDG